LTDGFWGFNLTKKSWGLNGGFLALLRAFLKGVLENRAFFDGNSLVKLW
jgi:hypothetical protein